MRHLIIGTLSLFVATSPVIAGPPLTIKSSCGPTLMVQVPTPGQNYNGPTLLEGDVYEAGVTVSVVVDGMPLPVSMTLMNPGATQFWRWSTTKVKVSGDHVATITATSSKGATTAKSAFRVVAAKP